MLTIKFEILFRLYNSCDHKEVSGESLESNIESGLSRCLLFFVGIIITVDSCAKMRVNQ